MVGVRRSNPGDAIRFRGVLIIALVFKLFLPYLQNGFDGDFRDGGLMLGVSDGKDCFRDWIVARAAVNTPPEQWDLRAKADREYHRYRGKAYDFEGLMKERAPGFADQVTVRRCARTSVMMLQRDDALGKEISGGCPRSCGHVATISGNYRRADASTTIYNGKEIVNVQHLYESSPGNIAEVAMPRKRERTIKARQNWPITFFGRWKMKSSIWRSAPPRRPMAFAEGFRMRLDFCTIRCWAMLRRLACR